MFAWRLSKAKQCSIVLETFPGLHCSGSSSKRMLHLHWIKLLLQHAQDLFCFTKLVRWNHWKRAESSLLVLQSFSASIKKHGPSQTCLRPRSVVNFTKREAEKRDSYGWATWWKTKAWLRLWNVHIEMSHSFARIQTVRVVERHAQTHTCSASESPQIPSI